MRLSSPYVAVYLSCEERDSVYLAGVTMLLAALYRRAESGCRVRSNDEPQKLGRSLDTAAEETVSGCCFIVVVVVIYCLLLLLLLFSGYDVTV